MNTLRNFLDNRRGLSTWADWSFGRVSWRDILLVLLYEASFYLAYGYGMSFSQSVASPFWFPDSVLLCALLLSPPRRWWIFVLAPLPIRLFSDVAGNVPMWFLLATSALDAAKGLTAATLLRRLLKDPTRLTSVFEFGVFFLVASLLLPALSAFGGAAARLELGHDYWLAWQQWFFGNAMAQTIITPAVLYWVAYARSIPRAAVRPRWFEATLIGSGVLLTSYLAANTNSTIVFTETLFYAPIPFLFWAAVRFGMAGASVTVAIFAFFAIGAAIEARGPFADKPPADLALALQNFLLLRTLPVYFVAVSIDQWRRVERSLQESEQRFRNIANSTPILMWTSSTDKLRDFCNQSWLKFTGRTLEQELGFGWTHNVHRDDVEHCVTAYNSAYDSQREFEIECRMRRFDGEYRWILHKGAPRYAPSGEFLGYVGSAIDITERKQSEENNRRLEHAQRLVMLGELTAIIAHEVRQPISAILSNADAANLLLRSEQPPLDKLREIIADIRKCDLRAEETIKRIREFLRDRETAMRPVDLNGAIMDAIQLIETDARRRRVAIRCELLAALPLVNGDPTHLQHVLLNLIFNGMEAMDSTLSMRREIVVTTTHLPSGDVCVAVKDHGCGIPQERLPHLFDSFFTTRKDGMGLGLSIARTIVMAHKGRIWAENNAHVGATFYFTVPPSKAHLAVERTDAAVRQ